MTEEQEQDVEEDGVSTEIQDALNKTGKITPETEGSESASEESGAKSKVGGLVSKVGDLQGSGKSLSAYEEDPIASIWEDDGEVPKGAKHIARGVDGLSPLGSAHPLIDIGVGVVLLKAENEMNSESSDDDDEDSDIGDSNGEMLT